MVKFGIGQAVTRVEDQRLLTGAGKYADDMPAAEMAHAFVLRSPHAHAVINSIDITAAAKLPGVLSVLTGKDVAADGLGTIRCRPALENRDGTSRGDTLWSILAQGRVRHVGDPVALIVAETLGTARDAAELIDIDYEILPAAVDTRNAARPGAPQVWDDIENNVCFDWGDGDAAATTAALDNAAHIVELELINNRIITNAMEPRAAVATYLAESGRVELTTPSQGTHILLEQLADDIFKTDPSEFRILSGDVGGGFGMKIFMHPEQPLVVWAARRLKRSVRWTADRSESFLSDVQGRDHVTKARLAIDADGIFTGLEVVTHANLGAYLSNFSPFVATAAGVCMLAGLYKTPAIFVNVFGVMTNTVPVDAYRGAGRPEAIYVIERLVDKAARTLGLAPDELRRRNFIQPQDIPYATPLDTVYDSGDFPALLERAKEKADWAGFDERRKTAAEKGRLRGIGLASYVEKCGGGDAETADVVFNDDDTLTIFIGTQTNGQGHETAYTQIMSDRLDISPDRIKIVQGDTDFVPPGMTGGSRSVTVGGPAIAFAAGEIIEKGKTIAAEALETAAADITYKDGAFTVVGTDRGLSLFEVNRQAGNSGLDTTYAHTPDAATYPNGTHICELEIDPDTGGVKIIRYTAVDDFGDVINPLLLAGQVHGGVAQGIGQALMEHAVYEAESGQLLTGTLMDYALPRADSIPKLDFSTLNFPCTTNPLGIKGAGEAGAIAAPPAVINAIVDALAPAIGTVDIDMPATPAYLWSHINGGR